MHIYCLTKLVMYDEFKNFTQFEGFDTDPSSEDYYKNIRENMFLNELKNCNNYAFSEIRIGRAVSPGDDKKENFWFLLFRNNIMVGKFELKDKTMEIQSIQTTENDKIITISVNKKAINSPFFHWSNNKKYQNTIKEIQIQCVKAFKKGEKAITLEARNLFKEYASKINESVGEFNEPQQDDFNIVFELQDEAGKRAVGQKIRDLCDAIKTFCHSGKLIHNARYNFPIEIQLDFVFFKRLKKIRGAKKDRTWTDKKLTKPFHYDDRTDVTKDFSTANTLHYENVNPPTVNLRWFDAPALTWLTFNNCRIFETPDAWKIFEANIGKLENLHILKITKCEYLTEIPSTLFKKLPEKVDSLIFVENNLTEISSEIIKVKNLKYLNLDKNLNFANDGIPWEFLPDSLEILCLKETKVTNLPAEKLERLKILKRIDLPVHQMEEINADELIEKFPDLTMDFKLPLPNLDESSIHMQRPAHTTFTFNPSSFKKKYGLTLIQRGLETYPWETLSETLTDLDLGSNKLTNVGSLKFLKNLQSLSLVHNQITTIDDLPESLEDLDLSLNSLTHAEFLSELKNLKTLRIGSNEIASIPWEQLSENLEYISMGENKFTFVGSMKHLKKLSNLSFHDGQIISVLWEDLPEGLEELHASKNKIEHVGSMKQLKNLESLNLEENKIISIEWECLPENLNGLVIFDNSLTYMGSMKHLKNLTFLNAHNNRFKDVEWESLPESLCNINLWKNSLTNVGSIKQLKNLYELDLHKNQISIILWEDIPEIKISNETWNNSEINLSYNLLTDVGAFKPGSELKKLKLDHNMINSVKWESLPVCLDTLDLSFNQLTSIGSIKHMTKLQRLVLKDNHLTSIDNELFTLSSLDDLELSNNKITEIKNTSNLNNFILTHLNLSYNNFNFETENLIEKLWSSLPYCQRLILNGNNLVEIPCPLAGKVQNLFAVNCNLEYICPKLTSHAINLNIGENPKYVLSLHPKTLYPSQYPRDEDDYDVEEYPFIIGGFKITPNTKKFRKNKNKYTNVKPENYGNKFSCKCCATCIKVDENIKIVENIMVMDFFFLDYETIKNKHDKWRSENRVLFEWDIFDSDPHPIGIPSQWKTVVRTRICEECQIFTPKLIEDVNAEHNGEINFSEEENITTKRSRVDAMVGAEEKNRCSLNGGNVMNVENDKTHNPANFQQLPPISHFHYDEPHGSSSKLIPTTIAAYPQQPPSAYHYDEPNGSYSRSNAYPQQLPNQYYANHPTEQYYGSHDFLNPGAFSNHITSNPYNDGSVIETIIIQDPYGNQILTAPANSMNTLQNYNNSGIHENHHTPSTQFDFLPHRENQSITANSSSTNIPQQQPHYFVDDGTQSMDYQSAQNSNGFAQLQNIEHFDTSTAAFNDRYFHPQNQDFQNFTNNFVDHFSNSLNDKIEPANAGSCLQRDKHCCFQNIASSYIINISK